VRIRSPFRRYRQPAEESEGGRGVRWCATPIFTAYSATRACSRPLDGIGGGARAMDVVLHVGAHRTASTTFQKTLGANGAALAAGGVVYWGPKCTRAGLFDGLIGAPERWTAGGVGRVAARGARARRAERAGARSCSSARKTCLAPCARRSRAAGSTTMRAPRVAAVAEAFGDHPVTIAMAMRAQDAWWRSVDAFGAGAGRDHADRRSMIWRRQPRAWRDVIGDIAARAGPRAVWSHEAMAIGPMRCLARLTGKAPISGRSAGARTPPTPRGPATLRASTIARLGRATGPIWTGLRAGAGGKAEFMDAGPGHAKSRPGQDKEGDDPMTENSRIKGDMPPGVSARKRS
jgi:hypothetical protein